MFYKKDATQFRINYHVVLLLISIVLSGYGVFKNERSMYSLRQNPDFSIGETPTKVCYFGIFGIVTGKAESQYFATDLFDYLKDNPNILKLSTDDQIINVIFRDDKCKVVVKNDEHLRGFTLPLEKSLAFPLYYRIATIQEDDNASINTKEKE
jgi:hypothetical protein